MPTNGEALLGCHLWKVLFTMWEIANNLHFCNKMHVCLFCKFSDMLKVLKCGWPHVSGENLSEWIVLSINSIWGVEKQTLKKIFNQKSKIFLHTRHFNEWCRGGGVQRTALSKWMVNFFKSSKNLENWCPFGPHNYRTNSEKTTW